MNFNDAVQMYELSGGGSVRVCKPFSEQNYGAIVEQAGRYPEAGKQARNSGRREFSMVLEGEFNYTVDGVSRRLKKFDSILVDDGQIYVIDGHGMVLVMVEDLPGGKTIIENDTLEESIPAPKHR